jgi:hypothetical protein
MASKADVDFIDSSPGRRIQEFAAELCLAALQPRPLAHVGACFLFTVQTPPRILHHEKQKHLSFKLYKALMIFCR